MLYPKAASVENIPSNEWQATTLFLISVDAVREASEKHLGRDLIGEEFAAILVKFQKNLAKMGLPIPFQSIDLAELALRSRVISPKLFTEEDDTLHQVLVFDSRPIGYSGFDCDQRLYNDTILCLYTWGKRIICD